MIVGSIRLAQVEELVASTGAEDTVLQTSKVESSNVKSVPAVIVSEATTVTAPEVPVTASTLMEPAVGFISAASEMALPPRTSYVQI